MKSLFHTGTLFYYDGPQVFEARDAIGGSYVGVMVEWDAKVGDHFLVAGVEPERLRKFRVGLLDLRALLVERSDSDWYVVTAENGFGKPFTIISQNTGSVDGDFLPEPGFVLHGTPAESEAVREARERNNLVLEVAVDPPEAAGEHRIRVETLVGFLGHLQTMVKHAYGVALRELPLAVRRAIDRLQAPLLDVVVPASPGSFRVLLSAAQSPDMLGQSELARALSHVDAMFSIAEDPRTTLETMKLRRGHFAGSYLRLLRFLAEHESGLHYSWAQPDSQRPHSYTVTAAEVGSLVDVLSGVSNLGEESVDLVGTLKRADIDTGTWRIDSQEGDFSGKTQEGGPSLAGLKLGSAYKFSCIEKIDEVQSSGREQRTLYLREHEPAG